MQLVFHDVIFPPFGLVAVTVHIPNQSIALFIEDSLQCDLVFHSFLASKNFSDFLCTRKM